MIVVENAIKLVVREVFEVLYSPVNAFRKIIEKPDFKGVLLVLVLVISSMIISQYIVASKLLLENRTPENDDWTESLINQHKWVSNGSPSIDDADYQMGNVDGNHSIASSVLTETSIWMKITDIDSINCSETGYNELFFWIKWTHEDGRRFKGLDCIQENPVLTLETLREMNEKRLTEVHCFRQKGYLAVVLQNCKGTYTCFEYSRDFIGSEEDWTSTLWSDNATSNEVFKWLETIIEQRKGNR